MSRYGIIAGDILINRVNTPELVGKSTAVPALAEFSVFESNVMRCRVRSDRAFPAFVEAWLSGSSAKRHFRACAKSAVSQASINGSDVLSCPFPRLKVAEQLEFVDQLVAVRKGRKADEAELVQLGALKQGIVADLLGGKIAALDS